MDIFVIVCQMTILFAVPLAIVGLAGVFAERSGVVNLALDGTMIFGGFCGALLVKILGADGSINSQLLFVLAMIVAAVGGALMSLLLAVAAVKFKADQTIASTAINMLAPAIVSTFGLLFLNDEKVQPPMSYNVVILNPNLSPVGRIFFDKMYISTFIVIAIFIVLSILLYKTKLGMHLRACGEHPQAADSVGINVHKMRYLGTLVSGALAGLGGYVYVATCCGGVASNSVVGLGFLALAIMIFGNWNPVFIGLGAILFGFLKCLGVFSTQIPFLIELDLPLFFYNMIPYVVVIVVLILTRKKSGCPKAEGIPYDKGQR